MNREVRQYGADLEVRSEGDGRTVAGIAAPFDQVTHAPGFAEVIRRGAFARTIRERGQRVKFLALHDGESLPLGRATTLREDAAGLFAEFRVSRTTRGDEVLELIKDGALDALSIGFAAIEERMVKGVRELHEVRLFEVSAVNFGAYEGARILATRAEVAPPPTPTALLRRRLRLL